MQFQNKRKSIRLRKWDYSWGASYYLTICSYRRDCIFGEIQNGKMILNEYGYILDDIIKNLNNRYEIKIPSAQIMPNHLHVIIQIVGAHHDAPNNRAIHESPLRRPLLSQIVGYLKMNVSKKIHQINPNQPVWQRNYYEHIIRNEKEYLKIKKYIKDNPLKWHTDKNNPNNFKHTDPGSSPG